MRAPHYSSCLDGSAKVDFVEIITENLMVGGGRPLAVLDRTRAHYPVALHGMSMSIGSANGLILLDVNSLFVSAANDGFDAIAYLDIRRTGCARSIWPGSALAATAYSSTSRPSRADGRVRALRAGIAQGRPGRDDDRARRDPRARRAAGRTRSCAGDRRRRPAVGGMKLAALQRAFQAYVLQEGEDIGSVPARDARGLPV